MNIYQYIAHNDPSRAKALCHKYGYQIANVNSKTDLGKCLQQLVAEEGETAMEDLVMVHPDKDLILEVATKGTHHNSIGGGGYGYGYANASGGSCDCQSCRHRNNYMNFAGEETVRQVVSSANQGNFYALATSVMILGFFVFALKH